MLFLLGVVAHAFRWISVRFSLMVEYLLACLRPWKGPVFILNVCVEWSQKTHTTPDGHRDKKRVTNQGLGILREKKSKYKAYQLKSVMVRRLSNSLSLTSYLRTIAFMLNHNKMWWTLMTHLILRSLWNKMRRLCR